MDLGKLSASMDLSGVAAAMGALRPLTIMSTGAGRDSMTDLALAEAGKLMVDGHLIGLPDIDAVAFSDLGHEWSLTYKAVRETAEVCRRAEIPFFWLRKPSSEEARYYAEVTYPAAWAAATGKKKSVDRIGTSPWYTRQYPTIEAKAAGGGYHRRLPILAEYRLRGRTTTRASAECTVWHKIEPIRELLNDLSVQKYGITNKEWGKRVKTGELQPHRMILGIAADEVGRIRRWDPRRRKGASPWFVRDIYPLVEAGITKRDETAILNRRGWGWVPKSGCMGCHHQPTALFWWVREAYPEVFAELVDVEEHSERIRRKAGLKLLQIRGDRPLSELVPAWGASTVVLKIQANKGTLSPAFMSKLAALDPGYSRNPQTGKWLRKAKLGPDDLPRALKRELGALLVAKGYDQTCAFGERDRAS